MHQYPCLHHQNRSHTFDACLWIALFPASSNPGLFHTTVPSDDAIRACNIEISLTGPLCRLFLSSSPSACSVSPDAWAQFASSFIVQFLFHSCLRSTVDSLFTNNYMSFFFFRFLIVIPTAGAPSNLPQYPRFVANL